MKTFLKLSTLALLFCLSPLLQAQIPGGGSSPVNAAMLKMFGKNTNFTAKADVRISDGTQELMSLAFAMAFSGGKMRAEMDTSQIKGAMISAQMLAQLKQIGADKTVYVVRPDTKLSYVIYPALKAYAPIPMSEADIKSAQKEPKMEKTVIGKETIDGHPCVKNKVVVMDDNGKAEEMIVWNATDLKDFAIQMQTKDENNVVLMKFREVQFIKPDAKQFEPPAGFTKYKGMLELQQMMMQKTLTDPSQ